MSSCARAYPLLLLHVTLLLAMVTGAGLATAARLKWDPSTYVIVRGLLPTEYHVGAVMLGTTSCGLLGLAHLAGTAIRVRRPCLRRAMLLTYAVLMVIVICVEIAWAVWTCVRVVRWLQTPMAEALMDMVRFGKRMEPVLQKLLTFFSYWHPLPGQLGALIEEAETDIPCNLYVGGAAVALVAVLQPAAVLLAFLCARALRTRIPRDQPTKTFKSVPRDAPTNIFKPVSTTRFISDKPPAPGRLKIFIRDGKFVRV